MEEVVTRPFFLPSGKTGCLLIHGLGGLPYDMHELGMYLAARDITCQGVLLPGHGADSGNLIHNTWQDWYQVVKEGLAELHQSCGQVFVAGHSMGGALALHLARHHAVAGVITLCAPLFTFPFLREVMAFTHYFFPFMYSWGEDIRDPAARQRYERIYSRWAPLAPVSRLLNVLPRLAGELPQVTAPALVICALYDHVVPFTDGYAIHSLLGSPDKSLLMVHNSYHLVTKDYDKEIVMQRTYEFISGRVETIAEKLPIECP